MVRPADRFDEGLRALRLGSRYSGSTSGSIEWIFALVEPLAREIRDQAVSEAGTRRRVPEILAGVNNDSTFNAIAAPSPNGGYIIAVNHGTLILVHDIRAYTLLATQDPAGAHAPVGLAVLTTKKKRWSKWLKFWGAALLLFAFAMQNQQNQQSALALQATQANELDSRTMQKGIGYETLYYSAKATGLDNPVYLALAAKQYFEGSMAVMMTSPGDKLETTRKIKQLQKTAVAVHDLDSFHEFIIADNVLELQNHNNEMAGLIEPDHNAKFLGHIYLILYMIGSGVALVGQALGD